MTVWHQGGGGPALVAVRVRKPVGGWYDVTADILHTSGGLTIDTAGRQSELARVDNAVAQLVLNNAPRTPEFADVADTFTRVASNGWDGGWVIAAGTAANFSDDGGEAAISLASVAVPRVIALPVSCRDLDMVWSKVVIGGGVIAATSPITVDLAFRYVDVDNFLCAELLYGTDDSVTLRLRKLVAASFTTLASQVLAGVTGSGVAYSVRVQAVGNHLRARAWNRSTSEPTLWQVEAEDATFPGAGQVAVRAMLEAGNTNSLPVTFSFDGLSVVDPLALAGRYTPGYQSAPVELVQGMAVQVTETVGRSTFPLFAGTLQQPEAVYGVHPNAAVVSVAAVDRFGELEQGGRTFISTLGEYIRFWGGTALIGYWPMNEPAGATRCESGIPGPGPLTIFRRTDYGGYYAEAGSLLSFGDTPGPPADDSTVVSFQPVRSASLPLARDWLVQRDLTGVSLPAVETVAFTFWYMPSATSIALDQMFVAGDNAFVNSITLQSSGTLGDEWTAFVGTAAGTAQVHGSAVRPGVWQLITIRLIVATGALHLWIDGQEFTGSVGAGSNGSFDTLIVDANSIDSAACHVQVYTGPATAVNRQLHLAQYAHGTNLFTGGLRFQRTDERAATLCDYAGITGLDADQGTAWMQRARLAGKTFPEALDEAVRTEQGRAFVAGDGSTKFHSRTRTRYNV